MQRGFKNLLLVSIVTFISLFISTNVYAIDEFNLFRLADKYFVTIEFDTDGAKEINSINFCGVDNCGIESFKLPKPKKKGYVFKGWYADPDFETKVNDEFIKSEELKKLALIPYEFGNNIKRVNTTLYAKWEEEGNESCPEESYTNIVIRYESNGGTKLDDRYVCESCEDVMIALSTPEKEGYYFLGWYSDPDLINVMPYGMVYSSEIVSNLDLYVADTEDECNNDRVGKVYARWATEEEFNNYISTSVEKEFETIHMLTSK